MSPAASLLLPGLALAAIGCGGCGASGAGPRGSAPEPAEAPEASPTVVLRVGETIGPVLARVGRAITVKGSARLGTGRSWRPEDLPPALRADALPTRSASESDGGEDLQAFALRASAAGEYRVRFVYGVPWEDMPEAECVVVLDVR